MSGSSALWRPGRLATSLTPVAAMVFLLALADIFISGHLESKMLFRMLPGKSVAVSGELAYPENSPANFSYRVASNGIRLHITAAQGKLWRGRLQAAPEVTPGEYALQVFAGQPGPQENSPVYRIQVFADRHRLNASCKSMARRLLGLPPSWIALVSFTLVIAGLASSYHRSTRQERQLADQDIVPIARMARTGHGWEIQFALGRRHGIRPRDALLLLDTALVPVGRITVDRVEADFSTAVVPLTATIAPTYWLAKAQD